MIFCKVPLQGLLKLKGFKKGKTAPRAAQWIFSSRGSSAIILSVMVSGSVLATIFYNQQSMQWALSSQADNKAKWSEHFIKKYGITLGSYLVANNLILCRKKGWSEEDNLSSPRCRWNDLLKSETGDTAEPDNNNEDNTDNTNTGNAETSSPNDEEVKEPSDFDLKKLDPKIVDTAGEDGGTISKQVLQYEARLQEVNINAGQEIRFTLTFDLVNWKENATKSLIGEIPNYVCRDTRTYDIIRNGHCTSPSDQLGQANSNPNAGNTNLVHGFQEKCKQSTDPNADEIENSQCEFISEVDQDYYIVLVSVQLLDEENKPQGELAYAGIRRPYAHWTMEMMTQPTCTFSCQVSSTPNNNPGCRGEFQPLIGRQTSQFRIKIINQGPGALYSLSLLRKDAFLDRSGSLSDTEEFTITDDLLRRATGAPLNGFVLLPGHFIEAEQSIECRDKYQYSFETRTVQGTSTQGSVLSSDSTNRHTKPFLNIAYALGSLTVPPRICMKGQERIDGVECTQNQVECGDGGRCLKPNMEPARSPFTGEETLTADQETTTHRIVETTVIAAGGGGGDDPH